MLEIMLASIAPCTLPLGAYGPEPIEWHAQPPGVWAWITWPHKPAERIAAIARGWNSRVVVVEWSSERGTVSTVVWRSAVTRREAAQPA